MYTKAMPTSRTIQMVIQNMRTILITLKKHTQIRYCVLTTKVMDSKFNPPKLETKGKDIEDVIKTLSGLPYEQLGEETQLLMKKAHIAIPNQIRPVQGTLTGSAPMKPLNEGECWAKVEETLKLEGLNTWTEHNAKAAWETLLCNHKAFSVEKLEMGKTNVMKHKINLTDLEPFKE